MAIRAVNCKEDEFTSDKNNEEKVVAIYVANCVFNLSLRDKI